MPAEQFRRDRFNSLADFTAGVGLEIGPLDRAIALKSDYDVRYVDVFDTNGIREHYRDDPGVRSEDLPELDFWLQGPDGEMRGLVEAVGSGGPFRWVIASHVIEHVPDIIGWLAAIAEILEDDGILVLAVPDRRYTFDVLRPQTTVGQMLQANHDHEAIPSIRAVYDYFRTVVTANPADIWAGRIPTEADRIHDLPGTLAQVALVRDKGHYVDCHVWMFTPAEFVEQIAELGRLHLVDLTVDRVIPTAVNELEFYVALKRVPRDLPESAAADLFERSLTRTSEIVAELQALPTRVEPAAEVDGSADGPAPEAGPEPSTDTDTHTGQDVLAADPIAPAHEQAQPGFPLSPRELRLIQTKRRVINTLLGRRPPAEQQP